MNAINKDSLLEYLKFNQKNKQTQIEHIQENDWDDSEVECELAVYEKIIHEIESGVFDMKDIKPLTFQEKLRYDLGAG